MLFEAKSTVLIRRLAIVLLLGVAVGMVTMNLFDPARSARLTMLQRHHSRLHNLNSRIERDNTRLMQELNSLESGVVGWQNVARKEHGMLLEGEVVFRFPVVEKPHTHHRKY
ncbi:MAG: cell division protein FtsB [Myxococcota bacterium]|jgi:cell division protein FtsB